MIRDIKKVKEANEIILKLANGENPLEGEEIKNNDILKNPQIIKCFTFVSEVLEGVIKGDYSRPNSSKKFIITDAEKKDVFFTAGEIGANDIAKCINESINLITSRKTTGTLINKGLKRMGILSDAKSEDKRKRTAINEDSHKYGFLEVERSYNDRPYLQVVANDQGKKFILDNIEEIMSKDNIKKLNADGFSI